MLAVPIAYRRRRRGSVLLWLLLFVTVVLGVVALGMDGGRMMEERRHVQAAADAAALAAAADLYHHYWQYHSQDTNGTAQAAALKLAAANGYANDAVKSFVKVHVPPTSGAFAGQLGYVEVVVLTHISGGFSRIFTQEDLKVQARAVAIGQPVKIGLILLRNSGANAFLNKAIAFTLVNSSLIVNSNDPAAYNQNTFGVVLASRYDITGNYINPGGALILGKIRTGVRPTPDPLAFLPVPDSSGVIQSNIPLKINSPIPTNLQPGIYRGGIQISGASTVFMQPGVYIMEGGGFSVDNLATVTGLEVMVYNTTGPYAVGPIQITSQGKVALTGPLSGTYQGISLFQHRGLTEPLNIAGTGLASITGLVYAAKGPVMLTGNALAGVDTLGGAYVCDSMQVQGIGAINVNLGMNPPRVPEVHLVE